MLSAKDLVFKERLVKKLIECYTKPYIVKKSNIQECNKAKAASLYKDSSSGECQSNSKIQRTSEGTESRRTKASRSRWSREIES